MIVDRSIDTFLVAKESGEASILKMADFLSLDWRTAPNAREVISRLEDFLTQADSKASVPLRLSRSTGEANVILADQDGHPMLMRKTNKVCSKPMQRGWYLANMSHRVSNHSAISSNTGKEPIASSKR